jgi:CRISPR/Cas system CSM-associated protein Csm3 (group 7 of RAMP superfamily)
VDAFSLGLEFGTKTTRGYGSVVVESIEKACFDISDSSGIDDWLAFDPEKNSAWTPVSVESTHNTNSRKILLKLKQDGGISVRRYTTNIHGKNETMPDMEQLTVRKVDGKEEPVIPGTTWAGAIRHWMKELGIEVDGENSLFGTAGENRNSKRKKSRICFSESQISGAKSKVISRNAIDRFTGGTVDGALFTEKTWYGGTTELIISLRDDKKATENEKKALAATLTDLHFGFLAVGGETSIGRGLFRITEINGTIISETDDAGKVFSCLESTIGEVFS